ncbi:MAG: hypothetical protein AAGG01_17205, partial [Planctomycetota bacterium]
DLEADDRRWAEWLPALAGVTRLPSTGAAAAMGLKVVGVVAACLLAVALVGLRAVMGSDPAIQPDTLALVTAPSSSDLAPPVLDADGAAGERTKLTGLVAAEPTSTTPPATAKAATILLVNEAGETLDGGTGIWLDSSGSVTELSFRDGVGAERPGPESGYVVAHVDGYFVAEEFASAGEATSVITLERATPTLIQPMMDGHPADVPIAVVVRHGLKSTKLLRHLPQLESEWGELSQAWMQREIQLGPGDNLELTPLFRDEAVTLSLPDHIDVLESRMPAESDGHALQVHIGGLDSANGEVPLYEMNIAVHGTTELEIRWDGTGEPFAGSVQIMRKLGEQVLELPRRLSRVGPGRFRLALVGGSSLGSPSRQRGPWRKGMALTMWAEERGPMESGGSSGSHRVEIELPPLDKVPDVIDVVLPRRVLQSVRVIDRAAQPSQGVSALIHSGDLLVRTDVRGRAAIAAAPGEFLTVRADGYLMRSVEIEHGTLLPGEEFLIEMNPAPVLEIRRSHSLPAKGHMDRRRIRINTDGPLLDTRDWGVASEDADLMFFWSWSLQREQMIRYGRRAEGGWQVDVTPMGSEPLRISGVVPGRRLTISDLDGLDNEIESHEITFTESTVVTLGEAGVPCGDLVLTVVDRNGERVRSGLAMITGSHGSTVTTIVDGRVLHEAAQLGAFEVRAWALGGSPSDASPIQVMVREGTNEATFVMP